MLLRVQIIIATIVIIIIMRGEMCAFCGFCVFLVFFWCFFLRCLTKVFSATQYPITVYDDKDKNENNVYNFQLKKVTVLIETKTNQSESQSHNESEKTTHEASAIQIRVIRWQNQSFTEYNDSQCSFTYNVKSYVFLNVTDIAQQINHTGGFNGFCRKFLFFSVFLFFCFFAFYLRIFF